MLHKIPQIEESNKGIGPRQIQTLTAKNLRGLSELFCMRCPFPASIFWSSYLETFFSDYFKMSLVSTLRSRTEWLAWAPLCFGYLSTSHLPTLDYGKLLFYPSYSRSRLLFLVTRCVTWSSWSISNSNTNTWPFRISFNANSHSVCWSSSLCIWECFT